MAIIRKHLKYAKFSKDESISREFRLLLETYNQSNDASKILMSAEAKMIDNIAKIHLMLLKMKSKSNNELAIDCLNQLY